MSTIDVEWDPFPLTAAEGGPVKSDEVPEVEAPVEEATQASRHKPVMRLSMIPTGRKMVVPLDMHQYLTEIKQTDYAPPGWVSAKGNAVGTKSSWPLCPPIEAGQKAMVLDTWGTPRIVTVTGMHEGEIEATFGTIPLRCRAWLAVTDEAPLSTPPGQREDRLTEEQAKALEEEIDTWSKFLGYRAEKHRWCETFEDILREMDIKPWRPGFKKVTLQVHTRVPADAMKPVVAERVGGEATAQDVEVTFLVDLEDIDRETYANGRWSALLAEKGYKNISQIYVHSKEPMQA